MEIKLTPRLQRIAELVPQNSKVADIGTDHGYISIYLLQKGITSHVIASDVNKGPLETARKNIAEHGCTREVELRLGSGLEVLKPGEINTVIIAGMGGILITELLQAVPQVANKVDTFILQPMQAQQELRRYLVLNGFEILQDLLVKEDTRIYEVIVAQKGKQILKDDLYYEIGFHLKSNSRILSEEFIQGKIKAQKEIIANTKKQNTTAAIEKYKACIEKVIKLEEVLEWLKS